MKRSTVERKAAEYLANNIDWCYCGNYCFGGLNHIKYAVLHDGNVIEEDEKIEFDKEEKNHLKKIAAEHNLKTYDDWAEYDYELSGNCWFKNTNEHIKYILDNDYFCDLEPKEIIEMYPKAFE